MQVTAHDDCPNIAEADKVWPGHGYKAQAFKLSVISKVRSNRSAKILL